MGFDNECILNIQSLAGEFFCPVCRLLVYPNEALQSQCTHLYCKPCLTYIVSTTQACPYDGYLVTEADAKPLIESNKALAETIGKITVHCLFHRSGCTWQGPLSECTSHCSGCAFGNSPVVCNRCGIQIVHRQVQEHAQNCPGVQTQAPQNEGVPDAAATGAAGTVDQTQTATQAAVTTSQVQTQSTATATAGKDPNQQPSSNSQHQAVGQVAVPTTEQWYQQHQQYQQYYQQYPGYNQYQQHYQQYYQQQAVPQYQQQHLQAQPQGYVLPQAPSQPQMQPQAQVQPPALSQPQLQPLRPPVQTSVAAQPQNHTQVNQQQQTQPVRHGQPVPLPQSYPQAQPLSYPQSQPHSQSHPIQPHPQHMQLLQYQQPHSQIQYTQAQIPHPVPPLQSHPQTQLQTHVLPQPPPQSHTQLHPSLPNQPQAQHTAANAVTGHHSYPQPQPQPQPQPHQQMSLNAPPQHSVYVHPHTGAQSQLQNQFPQQTTSMRPPGQVANIPLAQPLPVRPHAHQPGVPVSQHSAVHPVQQPIPHQYVQQPSFAGQHQQGPFVQQQLPVQSYVRPQGPSQSFQQHHHAYSQQQQSVAQMHGMQLHQPQNLGQPMTSNHGVQAQSFQQSATSLQGGPAHFGANQLPNQSNVPWSHNQVQLSAEQQSGATSIPSMSDKQESAEKSIHEREAESSSEKTAEADKLDATSGALSDAVGMKIPKSETDVQLMVDEIKAEVEEKTNSVDTSTKEFVTGLESHAVENAEPVIKKMVKEEVIENVEDQKDSANVDHKQEEQSVSKEVQDGPLLKASAMQEDAQLREQSGKLQIEKNFPQAQGSLQGPGSIPPAGHMQPVGFAQSPPSFRGSSTLQQRPAAPSLFQAPPPGALHQTQAPVHPSTQFRPPMFKPQGPQIPPERFPVLGPAASFGRGPDHHGPYQHSLEAPSVAAQGLYNQGHQPPSHFGSTRISHGDPVGGLPLHSIPPRAYGPEGQMGQKQPSNPMEGEILANQRPGYMNDRRPELHIPDSLERSPLGQPSAMQASMMRMNGGPELRDERFKSFRNEHLNQFPMDAAQRVIDRGEFEEDLKQFPRPSHLDAEYVTKLGSHFPSSGPFDSGSHGFGIDMGPRPFERGLNYDPGLKMDPMGGSAPSRFLSSYHDDASGRSDSSRAHPEFPGYGRRHIGGLSPRSPLREYPGLTSRGFGRLPGNLGSSRSGRDDIDGREFRQFGDPIGKSFHESRFSVLSSHMRRGELEGPGRSGDWIGQDFLPSHIRRGEALGPHNLRMGETGGFGGFPGRARMGDLGGPGNFPHPRLGEPGFRSGFSHHGFPNDGGIFTGDMESFDNSRKRKPPSMGWCRICKVDCETVDGLDLHSQMREHQKMAMDMVISIKQNAKKQKLTSSDHGSTDDDANKSRNANFEGHGKKH